MSWACKNNEEAQNDKLSSSIEHRSKRIWHALDVRIDPRAREAAEYALMEAGALGTETDALEEASTTVTAYFDSAPDRERVQAELSDALRIYELPSSALRDIQFREIEDRDWLTEWKASWQPVEVGRFIIAPPWSESPAVAGGPSTDRIVIRIEPGMAFGTGSHETTRLCLKAITRFFKGATFLDVGTGTGILAIAAAKLSPAARIEACDTDAEAIEIARKNARLNNVEERIEFRVGSLDQSLSASADFICANLTADAIITLLPSLVGAACGRLLLSGILEEQVDSVIEKLRELGLSGSLLMMQDGEWIALVV
jgi:ribosomal protein L11 methyltransferase